MSANAPVPLHDPHSFIPKYFAPDPGLRQLLSGRPGEFFLLRIEQMYPYLRGPVPAVRSEAHSALLVESGLARMTIGYDHYVARPGELLLVPAGQVYSFAPGDENTGFLLHFHPELLRRGAAAEPDFLTGWGNPLIHFAPEAAAFTQALLSRMLHLYQRSGRATDLLPHLATLLAEATLAYQPASDLAVSAATTLTQGFKRLLSQHVRHTHQVATYAELLHVTPNHLAKAVRAVTGKPPSRWIDEALVLEAKSLLLQTALPVADIAALVGIPDASYFSRLFRRVEGRPPSAVRQQAA